MKNNSKQKSEVFLYQIQNSNLSCKIIVENIRILQKKYPKSIHLVVPEIAIRFEEDLSSRYPRIIKRLQVELRWWLNQWRTRRDAKSLLKKFMNNKELSEIKFTSRSLWIWIAIQKYIYSLFRPYVFEQITTQEFIDGSQIKNIAVGDLIADTYIRFSGKPSFNHNSKFTRDIWRRAAALIDYYESYIEKGSKCILFVSYGSYIQGGIPLRLIYKHFSKSIAITTGSSRCLYRIHKRDRKVNYPLMSAHPNHLEFNRQAQLTNEQIRDSTESLEARVKGEYDPMMSYMGTKNREVGKDLNVDIAGRIVLMLHDFLDSPHVYRWMLFADFWDWATQTIDYCIMEGLPIAVKPHPNSVESNGTAERLRQKYSKSENVDWISPKITNSIIFAQKPDLIVSAYGYVLMEAAYKGIPGLVTGDYPGINFDIARQPNDRGEYFKALKSFRDIRSGKRDDAIILNALIANTAKKNNNMHLMSKFSRSRKECENINFLNSEATNDHLTDASIFMHKEIESFMLKMKRNEDIN